jgi:hypothetical protein
LPLAELKEKLDNLQTVVGDLTKEIRTRISTTS